MIIPMKSLFRYIAPPSRCGYLIDQEWSLEYVHVLDLNPTEFMKLLLDGWRRFGFVVFRPRCRSCSACRSLRVLSAEFEPNRSQRRARKLNEDVIELRIGIPAATRDKLDLYDRYHAFQTDNKGWPLHPAKDESEYNSSFVLNPFPTEEWCYYLDGRLVGVGYVDVLPAGMSAIYFFYDPEERHRSLGTWNVLCILDQAARQRVPHVYLGYYVDGCKSLAYKANFEPNEVLVPGQGWQPFRVD